MAIDECADELARFRDKLSVPAVIGAVTDSCGLVAIDALGNCSRQDLQTVSIDDQWHIGSCGKTITAMLYACLVEKNLAAWKLPVAELFQDIPHIDPGWAKPTVDDLLRGRAGVVPNPSVAQMEQSQASTESVARQRTRAATGVLTAAPRHPGKFVYSNLGYALVGAAIDRLAGMPYEQALHEHVLQPLGITSVGFGPPPTIRGHHPRFRAGPVMFGRGAPAEPDGEKWADNPPLLTPAGRLHVSIPDWAIIQRVFLNDGAPLLSCASVDHLLFDPGAGNERNSMSMGWASGEHFGVSCAMQGSNTLWSATALMSRDTRRTALTATNDGRMSVLAQSAHLASRLLELTA